MDTKDLKVKDTIEEIGKVFEKFGLTPMQGRIVAYFTISDPPEKTFDELVKFFAASKSSISNSLNYLLQNKIVDYKTYTSNRKRYFFITDSFFCVYFKMVLENVKELKSISYKSVTMRSPDHPEVSEKILKWIENSNAFEKSLEKTIADLNSEI